jgi:hypothetical protein
MVVASTTPGAEVRLLGCTGSGRTAVAEALEGLGYRPLLCDVLDGAKPMAGVNVVFAQSSMEQVRLAEEKFGVSPRLVVGLGFGECVVATIYECATNTNEYHGLTIFKVKT